MIAALPILLALAAPGSIGKALYERGIDQGNEVAVLRADRVETRASMLACASCHGSQAQGRTEAGITVPALPGEYDEDRFARAVTEGIGQDGRMLHPAMPSYRFTREQLADLLLYLRSLTSNGLAVPGVTSETVTIGFVEGHDNALAAAVGKILQAKFAAANREGGIYGRRLELLRAPSCQTLANRVLVTIAGMESCAAATGVLDLGPVTTMRAGPSTYTLLASLPDQLALLVAHLGRTGALPVWIEGKPAAPELDEPVRLLRAQPQISAAAPHSAKAILYVGGNKGLRQASLLAPSMPFAAFYAFAGMAASTVQRNVMLVYPALLPSEMDPGQISTLLGRTAPASRHAAVESLALAAADVLVETLSRAGRGLTQIGFRTALESIRDFKTQLAPELSFGPDRTAGSRGAYLVSVQHGEMHRLSDWIKLEE